MCTSGSFSLVNSSLWIKSTIDDGDKLVNGQMYESCSKPGIGVDEEKLSVESLSVEEGAYAAINLGEISHPMGYQRTNYVTTGRDVAGS